MRSQQERRLSRNSMIWWVTAAVVLSIMAALKYESLHFTVMDLGAFLFNFHRVTVLGEWWGILDGHVWLYVFPYAWVHSLWPWSIGPQATLITQALLLTLPIYWLHQRYGWLVSIAYLLYFPIWFIGIGNFHIDHLAVPLLAGFFLCKESGRIGWATTAAVLLVFVKEPFALQSAVCGLYLMASEAWSWKTTAKLTGKAYWRNSKAIWYGLGLTLFSLGYFCSVINWIIPNFTNELAGSILSAGLSWMGQNLLEIAWFVTTHPLVIVEEIITTPKKIVYLFAVFGSLGFISVLRPGPLLIAVPILAISMLSRVENFYGLGHHYTAGLIVPMIFAFVGGLPRAKHIWGRVGFSKKFFLPALVVVILAAHVALAPSPIGRLFWDSKISSYHYRAYFPTARDAEIKRAIAQHIPTDLSVSISVQNSLNWPRLVERQNLLLFPQGITDPTEVLVSHSNQNFSLPDMAWRSVLADYVVVDMKRPWYLVDKGCKWYYSKCRDEIAAAQFLEHIASARRVMEVVVEKDGFMILRRRNL